MLDRREILKGLGWLVGGAAACIPLNSYAPSMPVEQVQAALQLLGYLSPRSVTGLADFLTERALIRFKRHAQRPYRLTLDGSPDDVQTAECFAEPCDTIVTEATIFEIKQWVERGWKLPLHRFKFVSLAEPGKPSSYSLRWSILREDAAVIWREVMREASLRGATLAEPYGDTFRPLGFAKKTGTSRRSMHMVGRAVDLNQHLAQGWGQRYYISKEVEGEQTLFRLLCRTGRQDGSQGKFYAAGALQCWRAQSHGVTPLPAGWYVDLTELLASANFERIAAHPGWEKIDILAEWWHFQYGVDTQPTFLDECELIGISERRLLASGYTLDEIDRRPG